MDGKITAGGFQIEGRTGLEVHLDNGDTKPISEFTGTPLANTDALPEGSTNLYWTVTRFLANLTAANIKSALGITTLSGTNTGDQTLPTTLPASDVYAWAKAATKPTYTSSEVGAPSGSGTSSGSNTGDQDLSTLSPLAVIPIAISTATTLSSTHLGKPLIISASCTVTIPNGLADGFNCSFITLAGVTLTIALGGSVVLFNNVGLTMAEKLSFTLQRRIATDNYIAIGNL